MSENITELTLTPVNKHVARWTVQGPDAGPFGVSRRKHPTTGEDIIEVGHRRSPLFEIVIPAGGLGDGDPIGLRARAKGARIADTPELRWETAGPLIDWARELPAAVRSSVLGVMPVGEYLMVICPSGHEWSSHAVFAEASQRIPADQPLVGLTILDGPLWTTTTFLPCMTPAHAAPGSDLLLVIPLSGELLVGSRGQPPSSESTQRWRDEGALDLTRKLLTPPKRTKQV